MSNNQEPGTLLLIEGEASNGPGLRKLLASTKHQLDSIHSAAEALGYLEKRTPEVVLLDLDLPNVDGLELLSKIRALDGAVAVVVFTEQPDIGTVVEAMKLGADNFLPKPAERKTLRETILRALNQQRRRRRVLVYEQAVKVRSKKTEPAMPELVGKSEAMERVRELILQVAETDASIVLQGETGTGKGLVARAIHRLSKRAAGSFVDINCATLPADLLESEIFGHERGAFTGASSRKPGLLEIGDGGTVFLDEIAELLPPAQSKLLKCIEDRCFRRVGGVREISVNVRFVVATHQDLSSALESGEFRSDLYYRLNVFQITLPPLRDRIEDVLDLAGHFIRSLNPVLGRRVARVSSRATELLGRYAWPGNIRELHNVIERAMILTSGKEILPEHLPGNLRQQNEGRATRLQSLAELESEHIQRVLSATNFNILRSAEILQVSRSTLYAKMKKLELRSPSAETD